MRYSIPGVVLFVFCVLFVSAQDVSGEWSFTATSSGGQDFYLILNLQETEGKLNGTLGTENGAVPLEDVKLEGGRLSFGITIPDGAKYVATLTVDGNSMKGDYKGSDGSSGTVAAARKASR